MSSQQVTKILCAADPRGDVAVVERLLGTAGEAGAHAVAVVGTLTEGGGRASHRAIFRALGASGLPTFYVPGAADAPIAHYLRETHDAAILHPGVRDVHATAAVAPDGHAVFAGFGGDVHDDPEGPREEVESLRYPRWEPEYRLKILNELDAMNPVLLFSTAPAHKGLDTAGSEVLAELTATYRARLVVCGGDRKVVMLGRTLVVAPGDLRAGEFALVDLQTREATLETLTARA